MRGYILVDKKSGETSLYVPEAHIQCGVFIDNEVGVVIAFRTDGYRRVKGGLVPTVQWLETAYQQTTQLDVPDHVVAFAVESHRKRMELAEAISDIFETVAATGDKKQGFTDYLAKFPPKQERDDLKEQERAIALEIKALLVKHGGLS